MEIVTTISELRQKLSVGRRAGRRVGLVPTMGYLHAGHLALVAQARAENDITVVSVFVNPLQFGPTEDLGRYPRDLARDGAMLAAAGVTFLFAPSVEEMYPRPMLAVVDVPELGRELEGEVRPGHFCGVTTVVTKLFNIVQPDAAYFGEKDYQQVVIIRRMVEDLAQPVRIVAVPTVREADGLACSSRNSYLTAQERRAAVIVPQALAEAQRLYRDECDDPAVFERSIRSFIAAENLAVPEVVAVRDPQTLRPVEHLQGRAILLALFVRIGSTRLLDNIVLGGDAVCKPEGAE